MHHVTATEYIRARSSSGIFFALNHDPCCRLATCARLTTLGGSGHNPLKADQNLSSRSSTLGLMRKDHRRHIELPSYCARKQTLDDPRHKGAYGSRHPAPFLEPEHKRTTVACHNDEIRDLIFPFVVIAHHSSLSVLHVLNLYNNCLAIMRLMRKEVAPKGGAC